LSLVTFEKNDGIALVTIDNPPLNVLSRQVQKELRAIVQQLNQDEEVLTIVLRTSGEKAFVAGADIKEFPSMIGDSNMRPKVMEMHELLFEIENLPKPTIAVLDGLTLGGGCELALAFDFRIAEEQTMIGFPEVNLGIFPGAGGTQRLPRLTGTSRAKEMMFTGESITAHKAEEIGLINKVVPTGDGLEHALKLARTFTKKSLQSLSRIKRAIDDGIELTLEEGIEFEANLFEEIFETEDVKEGVEAFIQKRKPEFTHK